jgi:hypothetical protein
LRSEEEGIDGPTGPPPKFHETRDILKYHQPKDTAVTGLGYLLTWLIMLP